MPSFAGQRLKKNTSMWHCLCSGQTRAAAQRVKRLLHASTTDHVLHRIEKVCVFCVEWAQALVGGCYLQWKVCTRCCVQTEEFLFFTNVAKTGRWFQGLLVENNQTLQGNFVKVSRLTDPSLSEWYALDKVDVAMMYVVEATMVHDVPVSIQWLHSIIMI